MTKVEVIKPDALSHFALGIGFAAAPFHLCQPGDARLGKLTNGIAFDDFGKLLIVINEMGAGADDAHLAFEDVEELGHLIDAALAKEIATSEDSGIVHLCLNARHVIDFHGAELQHLENFAISSRSLLGVEEGTG